MTHRLYCLRKIVMLNLILILLILIIDTQMDVTCKKKKRIWINCVRY